MNPSPLFRWPSAHRGLVPAFLFVSAVLLQAGPVQPPVIGFSSAGGQVTLTWPADDSWLQLSPDLTPNSWINVTNTISETDDVESVTLPLSAPAQFFRLVVSPNLPPPTELTVLPEEDTAEDTWFAVRWDAVPQAISYNLYYASDPSVNPDNYSSLPGGDANFDITNNFDAVSNLVAGVNYYFVATAVATLGESAPSYPASGIFGEYAEVSGMVYALIPEGTNASLEEVPNVTITLSNQTQPELSATTLSDANGAYLFPQQPAGIYQLSWSAPGFIGGSLPDLLEITNSDLDQDLTMTNDGSGLLYGQVTMTDGSYAAQSDAFFGIQENVTVSLTLPGHPHSRSASVDSYGNYLFANLPLVNGATLSASNGIIGVSSNVSITGIVEADLALPDTPPVIVSLYATSNGMPVSQAPTGTVLQVTVVATNAAGTTNGLDYTWLPDYNTTNFLSTDSPTVWWTLPNVAGLQTMFVEVSDGFGGYATAQVQISTDLGVLFVGEVMDTNEVPIVGASVSLNGVETTSDTNGCFAVQMSEPASNYVVEATAPGYLPFSAEFDDEYQSVQCILLPLPPCVQADSTTNILIQDQFGTTLFIASNSLAVLSNGLPLPPMQPICITLETLDPCSASNLLSVSSLGVFDGTNVFPEFLAMAEVQATDATGAPLAVAGPPMQMVLAADINCVDDLTNEMAEAWWFDPIAGVWRQSGGVVPGLTPGGGAAFQMKVPNMGQVAAAAPAQPKTITVKVDDTISLPVDIRVLRNGKVQSVATVTVGGNRVRSIPVRSIEIQVPDVDLTFQAISPKEAPGAYFVAGKEVVFANKTAIAQDAEQAPLPQTVTLSLADGDFKIPLSVAKVSQSDVFLSTSRYAPGKDKTTKQPLTRDQLDAITKAYYNDLPLGAFKTTFNNWRASNFQLGDTARAVFFNACDLGVGRDVHYSAFNDTATGKNTYAFYAIYYPTAEDAAAAIRQIAVAAMEYIWSPALKKYITTFYVFGPDGQRSNAAVQDERGFKPVPQVCMQCHGGDSDQLRELEQGKNIGGDLGSYFIPFDLDSYTYSKSPAFPRNTQLSNLKVMNRAIHDKTNPSQTAKTLIENWYGGANLPNAFNGSFKTADWQNTANNNFISPAYFSSFAISCRNCHLSQVRELGTFTDLSARANTVNLLVYEFQKEDRKPMPAAFRTFSIFWGSENANLIKPALDNDQTDLLQKALGLGLKAGNLPVSP
jgi:hypothetical protein